MPEVPLEQRWADYDRAFSRMDRAAVAFLNAKAGGRMTQEIEEELDAANLDLKRAARRLEETEGRLAKRKEIA